MNLPYTYDLLAAANEQPYGFMKLIGSEADYQVRLMAEAGLVKATLDDGKEGSFTSINRVTAMGQTFLRAFKNHTIPAAATPTDAQTAVPTKRKAKLHLDLLHFRAVA